MTFEPDSYRLSYTTSWPLPNPQGPVPSPQDGDASARTRWLAYAAMAFLIPFQLHYNYLLNEFYHFGTPYGDGDTIQLAHLMWHNGWRLMNPRVFGDYSFFLLHVTPLLWLINGLSYVLPTHMAEFYAGFCAATYALIGLALFDAFRRLVPSVGPWKISILAVLAIGFSFNEIIMSGLWITHFEYMIPLGMLLFFLHYACEDRSSTIFFFILTLLCREDAGFHMAAVLGLIALIKYRKTRSLPGIKREAVYIICACGYSLLALWVQSRMRNAYGDMLFDKYPDNLTRIYTGIPFYAHLSWSLLWGRAQIIFQEHISLWLGFLLTLTWSWRMRNPYLPVGFIACIPWFLLNWTANADAAGYLRFYYAFPFILSLGWPVIAVLLHCGLRPPRFAVRETLVLQGALVVIGLLAWNGDTHRIDFGPAYAAGGGSYLIQKGAENRELVREFILKVDSRPPELGGVSIDDSILFLSMRPFEGNLPPEPETIESVIYMRSDSGRVNAMLKRAHDNNLSHHYCVVGTTICLFSNRTMAQLASLSPLLSETAP